MKNLRGKRSKPFSIDWVRREIKLKKRPSFFKRHGRLFSFLGALMVLGTFITKDLFKEHLKDLIDALDQTENVYAIRTDLHTLIQRDLDKESSDNSRAYHHNKVKQETPEALQEYTEPFADYNRESMEDIRRVMHLCKNLPTRSQCELRGAELYAHIQGLLTYDRKNSMDQQVKDLVSRRTDKEIYDERLPAATSYVKDTAKSGDDSSQFVSDTISAATDFKDYVEARYERITKVSYVLYGVGWSLALLGKLYGIEIGEGE